MHLKSALLATMLTIGLAGTAGAVTINGPHSSLPCTTCHQDDKPRFFIPWLQQGGAEPTWAARITSSGLFFTGLKIF